MLGGNLGSLLYGDVSVMDVSGSVNITGVLGIQLRCACAFDNTMKTIYLENYLSKVT